MNLSRFAVEHKTLTNFIVFLIVVGGIYSYFTLGQLEDPDFTECGDQDTLLGLEVKGAPVSALSLSSLPLGSFPIG